MDSVSSLNPVASVEHVTVEWLSRILNTEVLSFTTMRIGTGQVSNCYRIFISYVETNQTPAPESLVLKVASNDPQSRQSGISLGLYEREVRFYKEMAPMLSTVVPKCYYAAFNHTSGDLSLLLSDAGVNTTGDDIKGANLEQARAAVSALGTMHGIMLRDSDFSSKANWFERPSPLTQAFLATLFAGFEQRYGDRLSASHLNVCRTLVGKYDSYHDMQRDSKGPRGLVHGDYRLDNILFAQQGLLVVDWQTLFVGPLVADLAYFLGCSILIEDRKEHINDLIEFYFESVGTGTIMTRKLVLAGLREHSFFGIIMAIVSPMMVERTERGDNMFMTMMARHCEAVLDLNALDILPMPEASIPLSPNPQDEHPHSSSDELFWNESWYFDLVDEASRIGVYIRLGHYPNLEGSWYTAVITHPTKNLIAVTDYKCPHPDEHLDVQTDHFRATQIVKQPLKEYRVTLKGQGEQFDDPASVLLDQKGKEIALEIDVTWHTHGTPYAWRMTTRYEIPCLAAGRIVIDGEEFHFKDAAAQRDHSHGVRDWWSFDWMWCAFHLHDGTHIHGTDLRIPSMGRLSVGYIQGPNLPITELKKCLSDEIMNGNGLPKKASVTVEYGASESFIIDVQPVGHGPLHLVAPDGRVSNFTRCWADLKVSDGRTGVGWIEWNHVQ